MTTELESFITSNGHTIKVGSIITAYTPGYHVVTLIIDRSKDPKYPTNSPLIHYTSLLTSTGIKAAKRKKCCDAAYCQLASVMIPKHIKILEERIAALHAFQKEHDL